MMILERSNLDSPISKQNDEGAQICLNSHSRKPCSYPFHTLRFCYCKTTRNPASVRRASSLRVHLRMPANTTASLSPLPRLVTRHSHHSSSSTSPYHNHNHTQTDHGHD